MVSIDEASFVIADIPGLIQGAHQGAGLGDRFLGHVERCYTLLHIIDGTEEDIATNWQTVRDELKAYGNGLEEKNEIVVINKIDAMSEKEIEDKCRVLEKAGAKEILLISSVAGKGIDKVLRRIRDLVNANSYTRACAEVNNKTWAP